MSSRTFQKLLIAAAFSLGPAGLGCGREDPDVGSETAAFRYSSDKYESEQSDADGGVDEKCGDGEDADAGVDEQRGHPRHHARARGFFWHWFRHHARGQQQPQAQQLPHQHGSR